MNTADRIKAALLAYAAGDAAGAPWEGMSREYIKRDEIASLPARQPWLRSGETTDDTEQTLIVCDYLMHYGTDIYAREFMQMMATGVTAAGRATLESIRRFVETGEVYATRGSSNGAAMRMMPVGWVGVDDETRRAQTMVLSSTTHGKPRAIAAALVMTAMANASLFEGATLRGVVRAANDEVNWMYDETFEDLSPIAEAARGFWYPPDEMTTDGIVTVANVVHVLRCVSQIPGGTAAEAICAAVSLGGDTDTVAALVGGIVGAVTGDVSSITWLDRVEHPDSLKVTPYTVHEIATTLANMRNGQR